MVLLFQWKNDHERHRGAHQRKTPIFELTLNSLHSRGKPHAKFTVTYKEFVDQVASKIQSGFETQIKVLEGQRDQLMHVISTITGILHAQLVGAVEGIVQQLIDKPRIQPK